MASEYTIVSGRSPADLENLVNRYIKDGMWIPQGGICFDSEASMMKWHQAMVRKK